MSQVDLLLPQAALSACEPTECASYVDSSGLPPSDEVTNQENKQADSNVGTTTTDLPPKVNGVQARKKRNRRGKKRKWRPYCKLTWLERLELEDREAKRAEKIRAHMCACGMALAPYNTTQFLMDDHNPQEPDYEHIPVGHHRTKSQSNDSSDEYYSSPEDEGDFLQQQFAETYKNFRAERLSNMSKAELVQELMTAEDRMETLQKTLERLQKEQPNPVPPTPEHRTDMAEQMEKIRVFNEEILKLTRENEALRAENEDLRRRLDL